MPLPETMTHIEIERPGGPEVLRPHRVPVPRPGVGQVLIRVQAAGVNRPDVLQRQGHYRIPPGASPIPGLEVAGEVVAQGEGAHAFRTGDRVCALVNGGGYAEYCLAPEGQVLPVPDGVDARHAAAIPETFFTVWANLFELGRASRGDRALIHGGTSGIGTTALMLCREFGVTAWATAGSEDKCEAIRGLGALAINYRERDFVQVIHDGTGVDVILDIMGASYFASNLQALARDGRLVIIGFLGGARVDGADLQAIAAKRAVITGSLMRPRTTQEKAAIAAQLRQHVWPLLAAGRCLPIIDRAYPLVDAAQAHARMEAGEHIGKIVLDVAAH